MTSGTGRSRRPRDPDASRAAILAAARGAFTELGYERASIREIARRAGAASGLVLRHFTTKEQLFSAAFASEADAAIAARGTEDALEELLARVLGDDPAASPFLALIRSADARPEVAAELRVRMRRPVAELVAERTGADLAEGDLRMELFGALMIGLTFVRHVLGAGPLADASPQTVAELLDPVVAAVLGTAPDGPPPGGS